MSDDRYISVREIIANAIGEACRAELKASKDDFRQALAASARKSLCVKEAAYLSGYSARTVYRLAQAHPIGERHGRTWLIDEDRFRELLLKIDKLPLRDAAGRKSTKNGDQNV